MLTLNNGTAENVVVNLDDILDNVTDIMPFSPSYRVFREFARAGAGEVIEAAYGNCTPGPTPMSVFCLVDTSSFVTGGDPITGRYELYVDIQNPPEAPLIGPIRFKVQ